MSDPAIGAKVQATLQHFSDNEVVLDAFGQLACDPTSATAYDRGKAIKEGLWIEIERNLSSRWALSPADAAGVMKQIKDETHGWLFDYNTDNAIIECLKGPSGDKLREAVRSRLSSSDKRAVRAAQIIAAYREAGYLQREISDYEWEGILAAYVASWGELAPQTLLEAELVRSGLLVRLPYVSSTGLTRGMSLMICPALLDNLQWVSLPEVRQGLIDSLRELEVKRDWEQLRLLDEVAGSKGRLPWQERITNLSGYVRPINGVVGQYGEIIAISPFIRARLHAELRHMAQSILQPTSERLDEAVTSYRNKRSPMVEYTKLVVYDAEPEQWWVWNAKGATPVAIWVTPWALRRSLSQAVQTLGRQHDLLLVATHQSAPSIEELLKSKNDYLALNIAYLMLGTSAPLQVVQGAVSEEMERLAFVITGGEKVQPPPPPVGSLFVVISISPASLLVGGEVTAKAEIRDDKGSAVRAADVTVSWDDSGESKSTSNEEGVCIASHTYNNAGIYTVEVVASKVNFRGGSTNTKIMVRDSLPPPPPGRLVLGDLVAEDELRGLVQEAGLSEDERRDRLVAVGDMEYPLATATTHTAIFGTTGSGKSVTTKRLIRQLIERGVPVTIIDWHDEYAGLMRELNGVVAVPPTATVKPEPPEVPFTWNLLDPRFYSPEVTPEIIEDYVQIVVELLAHEKLMDLTEPMKGGLTEALRLAYHDNVMPTFRQVLGLVNQIAIPPATANAIQRRLQRFSSGSLGSIFCTETSFDPAETFARPMAVRAKHLTADHESAIGLLAFFLLRQAISHFKRLGEVTTEAPVRHAIVIDEAPMVIGSNPKVEREVIRMLQEVRKFGEGLVLVCRNPGINDDILRETNQKIAHKLEVQKDVAAVGSMLGLDRNGRALLRSLPRGVAFARIAGNPTALVRIRAG